ncbi:glycosyltransferase [Candidatus Saccharibacteria bacterium]|nr:glycosyltransferase [Candidatus Saccharibacteria bacterium]
MKNLKVALVHEDLSVPHEGAAKVFLAIAELFPDASIFIPMATTRWLKRLSAWKVTTSFMQRFPAKRRLQRAFTPFYPLAFESFDLSDYDLVISSSSRFAHGVVTKPETKHVCYMHSPGRMFWEPHQYFGKDSNLRKLLSPALSYFRLWDGAASARVDRFVANSKNTARRIKKYYGREASIVHPFADLERFAPKPESGEQRTESSYYLVVTRLAPWKRVDVAIEAAKKVGVRVKIVGSGPDRKRLEGIKGASAKILGSVGDGELARLYQNCRAFIMTQEEDFGITALEAQAAGCPVVAYGAGGALETISEGKTGEFFYPQTGVALAKALKSFDPKKYKLEDCRANAQRFSKKRFQENLLKEISKDF